MARARNIKPSFFANDDLAEIDPLGRILFIGLWTLADREGRLEDRPRRIKAEVLPYDDCDADQLLQDLHDHGFVLRYEVEGTKCIQIVNFTKHQDPHYKEKASELPAPEGHEDSGKTAGGVSETVRQAVFDRDGRACKQCGSTDDLSIDHIVPRSKGGSHDESNLQTLCRRCNSAKNNRQSKNDLDQSSANDRPMIGSSSPGQYPLIPDSGFLNPEDTPSGSSPEPVLPGIPSEPEKPKGKSAVTLKTFMDDCQARGESVIASYEPLLRYAEGVGLPEEMLSLCWLEFKSRYLPGGANASKKYKDWRLAFLGCVRDNWFKLWWIDGQGAFALTTRGKQAEMTHKEAA